MELLKTIQEQTERLAEELKWGDDEVNSLVADVNAVMTLNSGTANKESAGNEALIYHKASYDGGFVLFGGWTNIYDKEIPSGTRGHKLYLAFGGLGVGGWSGDTFIRLVDDGVRKVHGVDTYIPKFHYGADDVSGYQTGFNWFHDNVKSFMYMYWPVFEQEVPAFIFFDGKSRRIAVSVPDCNPSCGMGGGTVDVRKS